MEVSIVMIEGFERWLRTLGYAESTVYNSTNYARDFFFYLKTNEITILDEIQPITLTRYHQHLQYRKNKRQNGSLSNNYITSHINAIKRFSRYLQETGKPFFEVGIRPKPEGGIRKTILTQSEIRVLYKACENNILGIRDRAILSIYNGCGLRRSEGIGLNVSDILLKEKRVYVQKARITKNATFP